MRLAMFTVVPQTSIRELALADHAGDGRAGVDADPQLDRRADRGRGSANDRLEHRQRELARHLGMVGARSGRPNATM